MEEGSRKTGNRFKPQTKGLETILNLELIQEKKDAHGKSAIDSYLCVVLLLIVDSFWMRIYYVDILV